MLQTETDDTVVNGSTTTETVTDYNGSGVVLNSTVTTTVTTGATAPNGSPVQTVTIDRDPTGAGYTAQQEVDTTNADGSTSVSISDLTRNGTLIDKTVSTVSADGLTRTVTTDSTGNGVNDLTETDATVINAMACAPRPSPIRTATARCAIRPSRSRAPTGSTHHVRRQRRQWRVQPRSPPTPSSTTADGGTTTTQTDYANNGSMLDQTVTTVSADGLTTTTQTDSTGNGMFDQTEVADPTVVDASGNRTRTITEASANGTVYARAGHRP